MYELMSLWTYEDVGGITVVRILPTSICSSYPTSCQPSVHRPGYNADHPKRKSAAKILGLFVSVARARFRLVARSGIFTAYTVRSLQAGLQDKSRAPCSKNNEGKTPPFRITA